MREYDIFIPMTYNDGTPIKSKVFQRLSARLIRRFGGMTFFPQPNQGIWRMGDMTFHDQIVVYRVIAKDASRARKFLLRLKAELKEELDQEEILIIERGVRTL